MLYVHIPYCHRKCSYCAFYSVVRTSGREDYIDALCREIKNRGDGRALKTIYFGGGTPSMLTIDELARIKDAIETCFDVSKVEEVTIEANPEDLTLGWLGGLKKLQFFNRLSIGIQSFNDTDLKLINRRHDGKQSVDAVQNATNAGFNNISLDLIMGLPWTDKGLCGQQLQSWQNNLKTLDSLMPLDSIKHISCYELTVEEGTILDRQLKSGRVQLPDEDVVAAEYEALQQWCSEHGFEQYEVSNFALPGWHSRHNSRYWDRTPYIGVGAGAHSFDGCRRRWNLSDVELYSQSQTAPFEEELLTKEDAFNEYIMTALRTTKGIGKACLEMLFPDNVQYVAINIVKYKQQGLIVETQESYIPTEKGLLRADAIAANLFL